MTLKELREKEKISQAKLAKALGVSSTLISAIETGVKPASNAVIGKVKEVYGVVIEKAVVAEAAVKAEAAKVEAKAAGEKAKEVVKKTKAAVKAETAKVIKKAPGSVTIQSPLGGEITPAEILARIPAGADKVYIRVDQNKAYWVKGDETGSVDLW
ncbi:helix-turn-helix transcriptional regulator [uncultured Ruminobacter sp.]|uniref:helix-turn-helix domain-containing protein n=1 Tax=uncultured Ruminobacter sp. TaxID=538947 RepID=UPI0025FE3E54|nr:helix-turn-helix transcriptional regulator [uncultured Ruminobacter sp.]